MFGIEDSRKKRLDRLTALAVGATIHPYPDIILDKECHFTHHKTPTGAHAASLMVTEGLAELPLGTALKVVMDHLKKRKDLTHLALMVTANELAQLSDKIERDQRYANETEQRERNAG